MKDYIFSNDFSRNLDAMIYTCGYETCAPSHHYGPVVRSGYLIHYILKGKGIYKTDGHIYQLSEGDAFLIRPNTLIYYEADKYDPWTYTWIGFQGIKMAGEQISTHFNPTQREEDFLCGGSPPLHRKQLCPYRKHPGHRRPSEHRANLSVPFV